MAGLSRGRFAREESGVSDVLAMAFMFLMVIFAGVLLHAYRFGAINSATDRQLQMKAEYLYKTLETAQVENYSLSYFKAIAENLIAEKLENFEPVVPGENIYKQINDLLENLYPNYAVMLEIVDTENENISWSPQKELYPSGQLYPSGVMKPNTTTTQFTFSGKVTVIIANVGVAQMYATLTLFKP